MSAFIFLPLFMILNACLAVVIADILSEKAEGEASQDNQKTEKTEAPFRKAA